MTHKGKVLFAFLIGAGSAGGFGFYMVGQELQRSADRLEKTLLSLRTHVIEANIDLHERVQALETHVSAERSKTSQE